MSGTIFEGEKDSYKINISINAQADIEDILNASMLEMLEEDPSIKKLRVIFAVGLRYGENRKINFAEAGDIIDDIIAKHNYNYFRDKMGDELARAYGNVADDTDAEKQDTAGK